MPAPVRLSHAGVVVLDMERMISFFTEALGFDLQFRFRRPRGFADKVVGLKDADVEVAILGSEPSPRQVELLCYHSHPVTVGPRIANAPHANHIAVETDDAAAMVDRIGRAGGQPVSGLVSPPGGAKTVCYMRDPEGGLVEIIQVLDRDREYPTGDLPSG